MDVGILERIRQSSFLDSLFCLAGVAASTWVLFRLHQNLASVGFVYLVFVVLAAVRGGFWQATVVSVISVACLDYFFNPPIFSLSVERVSNWVELGAFEFTSLVVSRLSNQARIRAMEAVAERRETTRLYELARQILLIDRYEDTSNQVAALVRSVFDLRRVVLFDAISSVVRESGNAMPDRRRRSLVKGTRDSYFADTDAFMQGERTWFCVLRLGLRPVGALALCGTEMNELNARAVASLCAISLERARALEKQNRAEAERQAEKLRTAVLDALAHKVKTPLTVIRTAVSGLPAAGDLSALQMEMVSLIDQEARSLNELAHRLVGTPELDSSEFAPQPEPVLLSRMVRIAIDELDDSSDRGRFRFSLTPNEPPVLADRELILTAIAQLVENAVKYSLSGSPIEVAVAAKDSRVLLTMRTRGLVVAPEDRERIFDRFYRAPGARQHANGTGLGLSIVKSIASDHRGHVWADGEPNYGTTFSLALPAIQQALI